MFMRLFFRVFDKLHYAEQFLRGNIWTQPVANHANSDGIRGDENEGVLEDIIRIDRNKPYTEYKKLGNNLAILNEPLLRKLGDALNECCIKTTYRCNALSVSYIDSLMSAHEIQRCLERMSKFGNFFCVL